MVCISAAHLQCCYVLSQGQMGSSLVGVGDEQLGVAQVALCGSGSMLGTQLV